MTSAEDFAGEPFSHVSTNLISIRTGLFAAVDFRSARVPDPNFPSRFIGSLNSSLGPYRFLSCLNNRPVNFIIDWFDVEILLYLGCLYITLLCIPTNKIVS